MALPKKSGRGSGLMTGVASRMKQNLFYCVLKQACDHKASAANPPVILRSASQRSNSQIFRALKL
jgi:hypothetical protein